MSRIYLALRHGDDNPHTAAAYKQQPDLLAAGFDDLATFDEILASIPVTPAYLASKPLSKSLYERLRHFITAYHLLPQDALILAEAEELGVMAVVTLDSDWHRAASEFDIYTIP